jgi:hypothetical protein
MWSGISSPGTSTAASGNRPISRADMALVL